jgi:hypothetical protein
MLISRTTGSASVVPELVYPQVEQAVDWLCATFGFTEVWRAGEHRARIAFGDGVVIVADAEAEYGRAAPTRGELRSHAVMVKWRTSTRITTVRGGRAPGSLIRLPTIRMASGSTRWKT